jgi:predicted AlkP superfamily phosphohydrolase/phosphomutase
MPSEHNKPRTLIIGIDGATFDLVRPWAAAGRLPTLARLLAEGTHAVLDAFPNSNSAAAWTSIVTGYNPGQHGIFDFGEGVAQRGHKWTPMTAAQRQKPPFWVRLSAAGQCVCVLNVPISYPADHVNGVMLAGMDSPGTNSPGFSHPPDFYAELRRAGIAYILDVPKLQSYRDRDPRRVPQPVRDMVDARARTVLHVMQNYPWDTLMAVFVASDRMQHTYWGSGPVEAGNPGWEALLELYERLDYWLAEFLKHIDDQTTVIVLSDHGFGGASLGRPDLNGLLCELGLAARAQGNRRLTGRLLKHMLFFGRQLVPPRWQMPLAQALPGLRLRAIDESKYGGLDWTRTQAFATPHGGRFTINLRGRQPEGCVAPEDFADLRARLVLMLQHIVDVDSGQPLFNAIRLGADLFHGPHAHRAADVIVEWNYPVWSRPMVYRPPNGDPVRLSQRPPGALARFWKGTHRPEGIFIAWGPHVKRGAAMAEITQYNVAPTVLHLQGQPVPDDMDGGVLTAMFDEAWLGAHPPRPVSVTGEASQPPQPALSEDEMQQVEQRLRDLGYIE